MSSHMHAQPTVQAAAAAAVSVHALVCVYVCVHSSHTFKTQSLHNTTRMHAHVASGCPSVRVVVEQYGTHLSLRRRRRRRRRVAGCSSNSSLRSAFSPTSPVETSCRQAVPTASGCRGQTSGSTRRASFALLLATVWLWLWRW